jgi:hypothetical protein
MGVARRGRRQRRGCCGEDRRVLAAMGGLPEQLRVVLQAEAGGRSDREALLPAEGGYVFVRR